MGCSTGGGQSITVDRLVARKDLITECQQQMKEILGKESDQVKRVENLHRESVLALEGEYYTPPVSQIQINHPNKLSTPLNLPIFLGQPVPSTEGSFDQWLFQVEGVLATHMEEAVRSAVIRLLRGTAAELLEFIGYGEEMSVILRHKKNNMVRDLLKQNSKAIFPNGAEKNRKY